jgi:hypothetical protein
LRQSAAFKQSEPIQNSHKGLFAMKRWIWMQICRRHRNEILSLVALELTKLAYANAPERQFADEEAALEAIGSLYEQSLKRVTKMSMREDF